MPPDPSSDPFATGRFVRHLELRIERLDGDNAGKLKVSTPHARGMAWTVRGADQLWHAVQAAIVETTVAGYARWKGGQYDLDTLTEPDDPTEPPRRPVMELEELVARAERRHTPSYSRHSIARPDQVDPAEWRPNPDGSWCSPRTNKRWRRDTRTVRSVLKKRLEMGLPTTYEEYIAVTGEAQ